MLYAIQTAPWFVCAAHSHSDSVLNPYVNVANKSMLLWPIKSAAHPKAILDGMPTALLMAKSIDAILPLYPTALLNSGPNVVGIAIVSGCIRFTRNSSMKVGFLNGFHPTSPVRLLRHSRGGCASQLDVPKMSRLRIDNMPSVHRVPTDFRSWGSPSDRTTAPTDPAIDHQLLISRNYGIAPCSLATAAPCAPPECRPKYSGSIAGRTLKKTPSPRPTQIPWVKRSIHNFIPVSHSIPLIKWDLRCDLQLPLQSQPL